MIELGADLPEVDLAMPDGTRRDLRSYRGQALAIYFYPKDDTPGCTREAQDFSGLSSEFQAASCQLLGVSRDSPDRHARFTDKYALAVPLGSDDRETVTAAFGVWVDKSMYGRTYQGIERSTFLFDAAGTLVRLWRKVRVPGHAAEVLAAARELG